MSLWVAKIIIPVWFSGFLADANDAFENNKNLRSLIGIGWIRMHMSLYRLASWSTRQWPCWSHFEYSWVGSRDLASWPRVNACIMKIAHKCTERISLFGGHFIRQTRSSACIHVAWLNLAYILGLGHDNIFVCLLIHFNSGERELAYFLGSKREFGT